MNDIVLVIGGGTGQLSWIKFLKNLRHCVHVVDPSPTSPGSMVADKRIDADIKDIDKILQLIDNNKYGIVYSDQTDIGIRTATIIGNTMGVHCNSINSVDTFCDKLLMRKHMELVGANNPPFKEVNNVSSLRQALDEIGLPCVIKPPDFQGSRGVFFVDYCNINQAAEFFSLTQRTSPHERVMVERLVYGTEITVEGVAFNGKHRTLTISRKKHFRPGIASELDYPAEISKENWAEAESIIDRFVESSGLQFGLTHSELIISDDGIMYPIDIACRGGGAFISSDIVPWVTGVNLYKMLYSSLIGESVAIPDRVVNQRKAILHFFEFGSGYVESISGLSKAKKIPGVHLLSLNFDVGSMLSKAKNDAERQGILIVFSENVNKQNLIIKEVYDILKVVLS